MDIKKEQLILIFCPVSNGGLAEHVYYQAKTCQQQGYRTLCLVPPDFLHGRHLPFPAKHILSGANFAHWPALIRKMLYILVLLRNYSKLSAQISRLRPSIVLLDSYREYFAPIWAWAMKRAIRKSQAICVSNLHDPVRNFQVGPAWWHRWSIKCGYSFINVGLVHFPPPKEAEIPAHVDVVEVPVGVYDLQLPSKTYEAIRSEWGVKKGQYVFLSFGFIRDNKNIDLLIRALTDVKEAFLVIAGRSQSDADRPIDYYKNLAEELNVKDRCYFFSEFIADEQVADFFHGCDFVALTYSSTFFSQSGVLNLAAAARKTVLASSAESPLLKAVREFKIGEAIQPDSKEAIVHGMNCLMTKKMAADWEGYSAYAGWDRNITELFNAVNKARI